MDLQFLESIKPESSYTTHVVITVCIAAIVCLLSYILFKEVFLYISIPAYIIAMVVIFLFIPMNEKQKELESLGKGSDKLIENVQKDYGIKISKRDSMSIVGEYANGTYNTHTKITVKENDKDIRVLYYTIEDSKLSFYKDMGNDTFSKIEK